MTSVLCRRRVVQVCCLLTFAMMIAVIAGCTSRRAEQPATRTAAPAEPSDESSTTTVPQEETAASQPPAEQEPAEEQPAEAKPDEREPAEEQPADAQPDEQEPAEEKPAEVKPDEQERAEEKPAEAAEGKKFDPTAVVTVAWLPEPIEVPDATAETESEMKAYTEVIPETDAKFDMVPIRGGTFTMGSPESEEGHWKQDEDGEVVKDADGNPVSDEGPQHEVVIEPFWMGKHEVTWEEYGQYGLSIDRQRRMIKLRQQHPNATEEELDAMKSEREKLVDAITRPTNPYTDMTFGMGRDGYPAICMSQLGARAYCKWLSAKTGRYYRLPTEAEWEYACRAGTATAYSFGDDPEQLDEYAWHFDNSDDGYHKVGQKKPNRWGLYDMHGNACEWVLDGYVADYYRQFAGKTARRPLAVPTARDPRVARGGCWDDDPGRLRSAARFPSHADWRMQDPQIPQSIWYNTEIFSPGMRLVRPLKVPDTEEAKLYEPDIEVIREYIEAQGGKQ